MMAVENERLVQALKIVQDDLYDHQCPAEDLRVAHLQQENTLLQQRHMQEVLDLKKQVLDAHKEVSR